MSTRQGNVVALGTFDGVHFAHRTLIEEARSAGGSGKLIAITFDIIPGSLLGKDGKTLQIIDCEDKIGLLGKAGADEVDVLSFNEKLAFMQPEEFFDSVVINRFGAKLLAVGHDYRFGHGGKGNVDLLKSLCSKAGIELFVLGEMSIGDIRISSSEIRRRIQSGESEKAADMLGRVHFVKVSGENSQLRVNPEMVLPPAGERYLTAAFEQMPVMENSDEYDSIFWVVEENGCRFIRLDARVPTTWKREFYLLFGPKAGAI